MENLPSTYISMIETAELVAAHWHLPRSAGCLRASIAKRTAEAQANGRLDTEIVPLATTMLVTDKVTRENSSKAIMLAKDEGNRPDDA